MPPAQAESMRQRPRRGGDPLRPALLRGRGARVPPGRHADRMSGGGAGVLPRGASPLGCTLAGVPSPVPPVCEAFETPCRPMPRRRSRTGPPPSPACGAGRSSGSSASPPSPATRCCTWASALFALLTIYTSTNALYQVWGRMALLPFVFGALASAVLAWVVHRARAGASPAGALTIASTSGPGWRGSSMAVCVFAGALAIPLGFEILWRFDGVAGSHQQPEVVTVEVGGQDLVRGQDPYHTLVRLPHAVKYHAPGEPDYAGFLPYLPAHGGGGHPERHLAQQRAQRRPHLLLPHHARRWPPWRSTCAGPTAAARSARCRRSSSCRWRRCRWPPEATTSRSWRSSCSPWCWRSGDRPFASGVVFGIASAMKFTAWPLAALALFAARGRNGERRPLSMLAGMLVVAVPDHLPLRAARPVRPHRRRRALPARLERHPVDGGERAAGPRARERVPLAQPRACRSSVGLVLAVLLARHLYRHTPQTVSEVCTIAGVVMAALILLAPNPRVGYLLYPINFFVWAYLLAEPAGPADRCPPTRTRRGRPRSSRRVRAPPTDAERRRARLKPPQPTGYVRGRRRSWNRRTVKSVCPWAARPGRTSWARWSPPSPSSSRRCRRACRGPRARPGRWPPGPGRRPASPAASCRPRRRRAARPGSRRSGRSPGRRTGPASALLFWCEIRTEPAGTNTALRMFVGRLAAR